MRFCFIKYFVITFLAGSTFLLRGQAAANFVNLTPCRIIDTREGTRGSLGTPALAAKAQRDFPILQGSCGIPASALAYAFNITVIPHESLPYLTVWPTGQTQPNVSTLNSYQGTVVANAAIIPAGTNGSITVYAAGATDVIIDITGYFAPPSTAAVDQINQQIGQINQQLTQINQQISPLSQQISQVSAEAAQVSQQATQVGQQAAQISQQLTQVNQALADVHSDAGKQGTALGSGTSVVGSENTAMGYNALGANSSGAGNTAVGAGALSGTLSGNSNIALGNGAGSSVGDTNNSIEIGNVGQPNDNGVIRIGTPDTHTSVYMAGISNTNVDVGDFVFLDQDGKLGISQSSIRYKEDIQDIGSASNALMDLRPVRFRYKQPNKKGEKPLQYGLIAEEVAKVFPELVVHNQRGEIETVQYHLLPALLLSELQRQHRVIDRQQEQIQKERQELHDLRVRMAALESLAHK